MSSARKLKKKGHGGIYLVMVVFFALVLGIVVYMNVKNTKDMEVVLIDSIEAQLTSIAAAANEIIDPDAFAGYNSLEDVAADQAAYDLTLSRLRTLLKSTGAEYIYALKQIDGEYLFVFDTDEVDNATFIAYELSPIHESAFLGRTGVGVMNTVDEYGTYNTASLPIWKDGKVIGIIAVDTEDDFLKASRAATTANGIILAALLVVAMAVMAYVVYRLVKSVRTMQERLERIAHYDTVTGLPNRQYLLEHLAKVTASKEKDPFALMFIDLDNFKKVNDGAGHDAGDALLKHIANYLEASQANTMAFRPAAGILNIAARIGGDEFVQVVSGVKNEAEAAVFAQNLLSMFSSQMTDRYIEKYGVGLSIGIALYPYHSENFHVLIKYADIAMYHAKRAGKNTFRIYNDEMGGKDDEE